MQPENNAQNNMDASVVSTENAAAQRTSTIEKSESKKEKNKGMLYGMICLAILAIGGIGFGAWAMLSSNQEKENLNSQITDLKQTNNELLEQMATNTDEGDTVVDIDNSDDTWSVFSNGLLNQGMYVMGYYWHYNGSDNEQYVAYASKDGSGHLTITDAGNNMSYDNPVILELDDVLTVYYIKVGNGGVPYFYIVDRNGSVNRVEISENSDRQLEKVGDYTKIATILEAASSEAILVDINGNIYKSF